MKLKTVIIPHEGIKKGVQCAGTRKKRTTTRSEVHGKIDVVNIYQMLLHGNQPTDLDVTIAKAILFFIYIVSSLILVSRVRRCLQECADKHVLAVSIAICFVGLTVPISIYHTWDHLNCFVRPRLQSQIVRIIWMVSP